MAGVDQVHKLGGRGPPLGTVVDNQREHDRQALGLWVVAAEGLPNAAHVFQQAQRHEPVHRALVLDQDVHKGAIGSRYRRHHQPCYVPFAFETARRSEYRPFRFSSKYDPGSGRSCRFNVLQTDGGNTDNNSPGHSPVLKMRFEKLVVRVVHGIGVFGKLRAQLLSFCCSHSKDVFFSQLRQTAAENSVCLYPVLLLPAAVVS